MPLVDVEIAPGLVTERTERGARNHWRDCNRVRFRQGLPEKLGGWQEITLSGDDIINGVPRGAIDWVAIDGTKMTALGTERRLYQLQANDLENITPYRLATDFFGGALTELTDPFAVTDTETTVVVTHASHGAAVGTRVFFGNASAGGGITIDGGYTITVVIDANSYEIEHSSPATSTDATTGGTVDFAYEINLGASTSSIGQGYGSGAYNDGTWNGPRGSVISVEQARTWSLDTWGEDLIANPRGGAIYLWDYSDGLDNNRAALIDATAPENCTAIVVSPVDRHLIALGCTPDGGSALDPLVIRWCSQNDYTDWSATRTNTAGERRISGASKILSGLRTREEIIVFTDLSVYAMTFIGPPAVFNIRQIGSGCGLAGPLARCEFGGVVYWMSYEDFFIYDGSLRVLPCPVRNHVFEDLNRSAVDQFHCGVNTLYQEIIFFYVGTGATEINKYVIYNVLERVWYFGELDRTAWLDQSAVRQVPAAFDASGTMYNHETGSTANGSAMGEYITSWDAEVPGANGAPLGDNLMFVRRLVPDFLRMTGAMEVTLTAQKYPHGETVTKGPFTVLTNDGYIRPRIRGRQVSLRMESDQDTPETDWRAGTWRADVRAHGRR